MLSAYKNLHKLRFTHIFEAHYIRSHAIAASSSSELQAGQNLTWVISNLLHETHASVLFADSRDLAWNHLISIQTWPCETWSNSFLYHPSIFLLFLTASGPPQRSRHGRSNMAGFKRCLGSCTYQIGIQKLCTTIRCAGSRVQSKVIRGLGTKKASHEPVLSLATTPSYWTSRTKCLEEFGGRSEIEDHPSIHSAFGETNSESFKFKCTRGHWHLVYECFASSRQQCAWCRNISHRKLFKPTLPFSRGRSNSSFRTSSTLFCHRRGGKWAWQNNIVIVGPFASLYLSPLLILSLDFHLFFFPLLSFQQVHGPVKDLERTGQKKVPSVKKCESMALESRRQSGRVNMVSRKIQRFPEKMDYLCNEKCKQKSHRLPSTLHRGLVLKASRDERQLSLEFLKLQRAEAVVGPLRTPRLPGFELKRDNIYFLRIWPSTHHFM